MKSLYPPEERARRNKAKAKEWREANKDHLHAYMAEWRVQNKDSVKERHAKWRAANPRSWWPRILRQKYGLTPDDYRDMLVGQAGRCLICLRVPMEDLVIDHDHVTSKVRGLLCQKCNRMLGHAHDRIAVFQSAIRYLESAS
jgi:hypothetical protein